jgi:hypothetical protein
MFGTPAAILKSRSLRLAPGAGAGTASVFFAAVLSLSFVSVFQGVAAQEPKPTTPQSNIPALSLVPVTINDVGLDGVAAPVSTPRGGAGGVPQFFLPKSGQKVLVVETSGGSGKVRFSNSVPEGVPPSAFQWEQTEVPAGNAAGRLRYNGCASCPASFTLELLATSSGLSDIAAHALVKISLTASSAKPVVTSINQSGGDGVRPRFEIKFEHSTFDPSDSQVIATYASGLKYRLLPEESSQFSAGRMQVLVPRLEAARNVKLSLTNPYGSSAVTNVTLPQQDSENPTFERVNSSGEFPDAAHVNDTFSVKHSNGGIIASSGADDITLQPLAAVPACNQPDFIYLGAKATWLDANDQPTAAPGAVSVTGQPPTNAPLRPSNKTVRVQWTLNGLGGDKFYQVAFGGVTVVGVCSDRVVH